MRISYSLGSVLSVNEVLQCAKTLSTYNPHTIWIPETWGMENFSMISAVSQIIKNSQIGSSIINIFSRSPALIAMGAATVDTISDGRLILGLGTSSKPIVEEFHGQDFTSPVLRLKEYTEIIKLALSGNKIEYKGRFFSLSNFSLLIKPPRKNIPIYFGAVNQKMVDLCWEIADGVIFYLRPLTELEKIIKKMQTKRKIDVACQIITCVSHDSEKAIERAKKTLAFYVSVGSIYREFLSKNGFLKETESIFDEFKNSGFSSNDELVPQSMLDSLTICGTPDECKKQFQKFVDSGIDSPILQFNPIGNVTESIRLVADTFSGNQK